MLSRNQQQQNHFNNIDFRKKQIDTLKVFNNNVVEINPYEEYCVYFESAGRDFVIIIYLGDNFPNERPTLMITPIVQHSWVNANTGEIESAPGLLNYSTHTDLGRVVQAIAREFERFPPEVIKSSKSNYQQIKYCGTIPNNLETSRVPNITTLISSTTKPAKSSEKRGCNDISNPNSVMELTAGIGTSAVNSVIGLPKLNENNLPNLSTLSLDELKQLDNDPEFFDDFIEEMSVVQQLNEELDSMINQVEVISRENESKETYLIELKRKLSDDVTAIKNLGEKCDLLNKKYLKKSDEYAPQHIRELLQIAASNADTDCEHHVEQFLNGKIDVQTFLNSYTHSKKLSSERKAKEERLGQQLSALERAGI